METQKQRLEVYGVVSCPRRERRREEKRAFCGARRGTWVPTHNYDTVDAKDRKKKKKKEPISRPVIYHHFQEGEKNILILRYFLLLITSNAPRASRDGVWWIYIVRKIKQKQKQKENDKRGRSIGQQRQEGLLDYMMNGELEIVP